MQGPQAPRIGAVLVLSVGLLVPGGEARGDEAGALTYEAALTRGEQQSPLVRRAIAERQVAEAGRVGAAVLVPYNPTLSLTLGGRRDRSSSVPLANGFEWGLRLELPIEVAGQRGQRRLEADRWVEVARRREALARIEARARIASAFVGLQLAKELAQSGREFESLGERLLASARSRVQAGAASDVEVRLAEAELGRLRHQRLEAELLVTQHAAELRQWLALSVGTPLEVVAPVDAPPPVEGDLAALMAAAQRRRQDLAMLVAAGSALDAQLARLRREVVPSPVLLAEVAQQQPGQTYAGAGVGIALPIFARNQGQIAVARAEASRVQTDIELQRRQIELEVATLFETVRQRRNDLQLWQEQIIPAALASAQLVETGWRAGKFDLFRVVQVQREASEARRKRLEVLGELWTASINLLRVVGMP